MKCFLFGIVFLTSSITLAQSEKDLEHVSLDEFIAEMQIDVGSNEEISMVWTIPIEFWILSFMSDTMTSDYQKQSLIETLRPYYIVAVVDGKFGLFGSVEYSSMDSIQKSLEVTVDGAVHRPLKDSYLPTEVQILLSSFKPLLSSMLGMMGENMHFFVFNDRNAKDKRILELYEFGNDIQFEYLNKKVSLKTPVGALLKKKKCPVDGEEYNGGWKFCPYHGELLKKK